MNRLIAGPYLGEFGWELCSWNPRVRRLADEEFDEVVVLAPERSRALYEFADVFIPVNAVPGSSDYMQGDLEGPAPDVPKGDALRISPTRQLVRAEQRGYHDAAALESIEKSKRWRKYLYEHHDNPLRVDVCLALRPPKETRGVLDPRKAWPAPYAEILAAELLQRGLQVACIGGAENRYIEGTIDARRISLERTMGALRVAGVTIGPSSGPMHLAQLCGCAVVTWYDSEPLARAASRARYERVWNPFRTPCVFLEGVPTPGEVLAAAFRVAQHSAGPEGPGLWRAPGARG